MTKPNITVSFRWFDFWVGLFYDRVEKVLYLNPLPMLAVKIIQPDPDEAAWQYSAIAAAYIILATLRSSAVRRDSLCPSGADARFYYSAAPSGGSKVG